MSLNNKILTISNPTIGIDEMSIDNYESGNRGRLLGPRDSKKLGDLYPYVEINGYKFDENEIVRLIIDDTGFYPRVQITVAVTNGVFVSKTYPKDGDPVSIFIRSKQKEFKPIRLDFEITFINSSPSTDSDGEKIAFVINGIIRIPNLYTEICKAYRNMTSYDCLLRTAEDLQLGFASNDTNTDDKMTWICPYDSYLDFIKNTTQAAYKNEESFFDSWIDHHYYLNFININQQFSEELEIDKAISNLSMLKDYDKGQTPKSVDLPLILSNFTGIQGSSMYISQYTLHNNTGLVGIHNGYRRAVQYYESNNSINNPEDSYRSFLIEAMNTRGAEADKIPLKGRNNENIYDQRNKYKWLGTQYSQNSETKNVHDNYHYARILNWQNGVELDKMILQVVLPQANFNLYRGQRIPIVIINEGSLLRKQSTKSDEENPHMQLPFSYDRFLSGYYMVKGMKYRYDVNEAIFKMDVFLTRREWPLPA